ISARVASLSISRPPPPPTLFPYTTLFRSRHLEEERAPRRDRLAPAAVLAEQADPAAQIDAAQLDVPARSARRAHEEMAQRNVRVPGEHEVAALVPTHHEVRDPAPG